MLSNWKHRDWPKLSYDASRLADYEKQFLHKAGVLLGSLKHVKDADSELLKIELISDEALKTSEIEGELLNRHSLQSSIRRQFGLQADPQKITPAEEGISEMMVDLYTTYHNALDHAQLFAWHKMLTKGRKDLQQIGAYRSHNDPMQVVSGPLHRPTIHFEAPPSAMVQKEMTSFIEWFNTGGTLGALTRAGIAHLYFESIHPFEDGNGRIGRVISEKALSQHLGRPTLIAISYTIERERKKYYAALQENTTSLEVTDWLVYFCEMVLQAQDHTQRMVDFLIGKTQFYHAFANRLNPRQTKVVERMFREGVDGFKGGLSAEKYMRITGTTSSTATRDLQQLGAMGALVKTGELKGTRYWIKM